MASFFSFFMLSIYLTSVQIVEQEEGQKMAYQNNK